MRWLLAMSVLVLLAGCVVVPVESWDEVPTAQKYQTDRADQIQAGDVVRVRTIKQNTHVFRVYKVEDNAFFGVARNSKKYRVPYKLLASLEVKRLEPEVVWMPVFLPGNFNPVGSFNVCC
jgi:hypothetical protein